MITFLLVEDDDIHAHLVTRSMQNARVANKVYRAVDGAEALQILRQEGPHAEHPRPDVILLDLKLPKVSGHEVLEAIKEDESLKTIPVVVMTTSDAERDREAAYQHHVNSYVVKPVDFEKFQRLVHDLSLYWGLWNAPPT